MDRQLYFGRAQVPKSSYIILVSSHAKPQRTSERQQDDEAAKGGGPTLTSSNAMPRKALRDTLHFEAAAALSK